MAHRLAHPRFQVPRTYSVQVAGRPTPETFAALKEGMFFHEGRFHLKWIRRIGTKGNSRILEVGLDHGQNREIRRLFARVGHKVMRLKRSCLRAAFAGSAGGGPVPAADRCRVGELRELSSTPRRRRPKPAPKPQCGRDSARGGRRSSAEKSGRKTPGRGKRPAAGTSRPRRATEQGPAGTGVADENMNNPELLRPLNRP